MAATNLVDFSLLSRSLSSSQKQEGNGNSSSSRVNIRRKINQPTHCRKRHRGKRRPRKENRRRVRPGKSRSGFIDIAMPRAPFNDNNFLISQRNLVLEGESAKEKACSEMRSYGSCVGDYVLSLPVPHSHSQPGSTCTATAAHNQTKEGMAIENRSVCLLPSQKGITREHVSETWSLTSSSIDTSDYSSLESPVDSSNCSTTGTGKDDMCSSNNDDIFDEDFELRNFEAEYAAQQQELRDELMKLPRRELEERYFTLLDQTRVLEERREKSKKMQELELQVQSLEEENRQLRLQQVDLHPDP